MRQFTSKQDFCDWLDDFRHPNLTPGWADEPNLVTVDPNGYFLIEIPYAANDLVAALNGWIQSQQASQQVTAFNYQIKVVPKALETPATSALKGVKNIIAVSSGKGGVGKSTTSVNLALAIAQSGATVGLLDADIYGPSVPLMLGQLDAHPEVRDNKWMQPIFAHGIYTHSIGYLISKDDAAIWRGPMAAKALGQLVNETEWPDLDYLIVDMPPGTGDIQLSLGQQIPVTGAVIVTTPQDLALADARKGAAMFSKMDVPVVGLVENMSYHICSHCGEKEHIFGAGGAEKMSAEYGLDLLAQIPLHIAVREDVDNGCPTVVARPESEHTEEYLALAESVCARLFWRGTVKPEAISFTLVD
ncbi:iron-sulfur cluster carrier protein ApbC [Vibrio sinensis]|uniref:Iron-sulfur cluster carrier protein n=1 Tax=Vibrio sinensis TaxID=2302434 RepID=A0A3A6QB62_9VIBR|nr:iron-sulfur cluster carrier protein ApbC [Vibrio sinensis]RJX68461.1 iron-sulfur cluster carrier protein ApbC [Vibrio sinensis]